MRIFGGYVSSFVCVEALVLATCYAAGVDLGPFAGCDLGINSRVVHVGMAEVAAIGFSVYQCLYLCIWY